MEEQEVLRLFGLFTGLSEEEAAGWAVLCRSTIAELTGRLRPVWTPLRMPTGNAFRLPLPPWQPTATVCWAPVRPPTASRWGRLPSPPGAAREESALPPHSSRSIWQRCGNWWTPEHSASKG